MQDFVRELLERKVLISPGILEAAKQKTLDDLVGLSSGSVVLTCLEPQRDAVTISRYKPAETLSPADISAFYRSRFNSLKKTLASKSRPVSINKASGASGDVEIIGFVRARHEGGILVEDETGILEVRCQTTPSTGDVVCINGFFREGVMFAKDVSYPDVALRRKLGQAHKSVIFCEEPVGQKADYVFSFNEIPAAKLIPNPATIKITSGGTATITAYKPPAEASVKQAEAFLKKRHLMLSADQITGPEDNLTIAETPDVLWLASAANLKSVYKGVLIVLSKACRIDLSTKEVEFL